MMSSIQERLQLKRAPLDNWNTREQLCLASAVVRSGDQNWMSVSRALKSLGDPGRPPDWYSQKSCAAQYGALLEHVETPKRKKRTSEGGVETPQESILKRLTQERISEIQKQMAEVSQQYLHLKESFNEVKSPSVSSEHLKEVNLKIESEKRVQEREQSKHQQWLREREERRIRAEKGWRPSSVPTCQTPPPSSGSPGSSPLLTSLLKSSSSPVMLPQQTTPSLLHITHPSIMIDTMSPSAGAPTLSMLLEKPSGTISSSQVLSAAQADTNKNAVIEQIKNQLQEIENQLKASASPKLTGTLPVTLATPPGPINPSITGNIAVSMSKMLPVTNTLTTSLPETSPQAKSLLKTNESALDIDDIEIKAEDVYAFSDIDLEIPPVSSIHKNNVRIADKPKTELASETVEKIQQLIGEEPFAPPTVEGTVPSTDTIAQVKEDDTLKESESDQKELDKGAETVQPEQIVDVEQSLLQEVEEKKEDGAAQNDSVVEDTNTDANCELEAEVEPIQSGTDKAEIVTATSAETKEDIEKCEKDVKLEVQEGSTARDASQTPTVEANEDQQAEKDEPKSESLEPRTYRTVPDKSELEEATETDDDTPMEVIREEEKVGRRRRDYSRRKTDLSDDDSSRLRFRGSGSECSAPESPSTISADVERDHRLWKKSVMLVYSRLCAHKCASLFLRPITDDMAPGYSLAVKRPMDLTTIRKNIDNGVTRTTGEFQRDVLLMLSNSLMYNSSSHRVHQMAKEMHEEAVSGLNVLVQAQAHSALASTPTPGWRANKRKAAQMSSGSGGGPSTPPTKIPK